MWFVNTLHTLRSSAITFTALVYQSIVEFRTFNPLTGTSKPQSNGPLYSNTVIETLAVDGWAVTFGTASKGPGGLRPRPVPSWLYQM